MGYVNLKSNTIPSGETFTIPEGFFFASINPSSGASFTITDSASDVTGSITVAFSFPMLTGVSLQGYAQHVITASGGSVEVVYITGN